VYLSLICAGVPAGCSGSNGDTEPPVDTPAAVETPAPPPNERHGCLNAQLGTCVAELESGMRVDETRVAESKKERDEIDVNGKPAHSSRLLKNQFRKLANSNNFRTRFDGALLLLDTAIAGNISLISRVP
jgi:hypothetical protein